MGCSLVLYDSSTQNHLRPNLFTRLAERHQNVLHTEVSAERLEAGWVSVAEKSRCYCSSIKISISAPSGTMRKDVLSNTTQLYTFDANDLHCIYRFYDYAHKILEKDKAK